MKRYISILFTAGLAITSCSVNETTEIPKNNEGNILYASTETGTKTSLGTNEDGIYKVLWSEGDQITIMTQDGLSAIYKTEEGGQSRAIFVLEDGPGDINFEKGLIAGYPTDEMYINSTDPADPVYFTIPSVQNYAEGTFDDNILPMLTDVTTDINLKFYNAAGIIKLMIASTEEVEVDYISIQSENEMISGECGYIPETKSYFFDETMLSDTEVTISCEEGVLIGEEAKPFFFVVPHQEYSALTIIVATTDGLQQTFRMKPEKTLDVKRSTVLNIPLYVDNLGEFEDPEEPDPDNPDPDNPDPDNPDPDNPDPDNPDPDNPDPDNPDPDNPDPDNPDPDNPDPDNPDPDNPDTPTDGPVVLTLGEITSKTFSFSLEIKEADSYFYGLQTKSSFEYAMENGELLDELYYATPVTSPLTYNGDIFGFQEEFKEDLFLYPGQDYILWIVTYDESGMYTDEDVYTIEINMPRFTGGSSIEVESSLDEVSYTHLQFSLSAQGAQYIYWAIISTEDLYEYPYEEDKVNLLLDPESRSYIIDRSADIARMQELRPGVEYTLIAVAVDKSGKHGPLLEERYFTDEIPYNSLTVEIDKDIDKVLETGELTWKVSDGEAAEFVYYLMGTSERNWISTHMEDYTYVQEQIALLKMKDQGNYQYHETSNNTIQLDSADGKEYILIVVAVDDNGNCSRSDHWIFTY